MSSLVPGFRRGFTPRLQQLTRAVVLLEQSRSPEHLARATGLPRDWLATAPPEPRLEELKRAFAEWLWVLYRRSKPGDGPAKPPPELTLEDVTMTLEERVISWREPVTLTLPRRQPRTLSAFDLENGAPGLTGTLGDGTGKWRLFITAGDSVVGMSLLDAVSGHLTNISTTGVATEASNRPPS